MKQWGILHMRCRRKVLNAGRGQKMSLVFLHILLPFIAKIALLAMHLIFGQPLKGTARLFTIGMYMQILLVLTNG